MVNTSNPRTRELKKEDRLEFEPVWDPVAKKTKTNKNQLGVGVNVYNPSTWGGVDPLSSRSAWSTNSVFQASQVYPVRPCVCQTKAERSAK